MKISFFRSRIRVALLVLASGIASLHADITVRLSVKFILQPNGTRPAPESIRKCSLRRPRRPPRLRHLRRPQQPNRTICRCLSFSASCS